jgi:hypothetical protein
MVELVVEDSKDRLHVTGAIGDKHCVSVMPFDWKLRV